MSSPSYFSGSFKLLSNKFKEILPYLLALTGFSFVNDLLIWKFGNINWVSILGIIFAIISFIVGIFLIKTIIHLLRNEETSISKDIDFLKKHYKDLLKTTLLYLWKFLKIAGIPLLIVIASLITFFVCSASPSGFSMPGELIENIFKDNLKAGLTAPCTIGFYLATIITPISLIVFIILAIIASIKLFFTFYSFVDHKTKITEDHTKISNELTKGKKGEFIVFLIVAGFGFAIIAFLGVIILSIIFPNEIKSLFVNSLGMSVFTVLYTSFFAQYYLTLKESSKK